MDNKGVSKYDLNKHCTVLAVELFARLRSTYAFANELNSMARQSAAGRALASK